jgi:anti-anti-sigma regulatory factor
MGAGCRCRADHCSGRGRDSALAHRLNLGRATSVRRVFHFDPAALPRAVAGAPPLRNDALQPTLAHSVLEGVAVVEGVGCHPGRPVETELLKPVPASGQGERRERFAVCGEHVEDHELDRHRRIPVRFIGEHDLTTRVSTIDLLQQLVAENDQVTADLSDATFVDSSFLQALVTANRSAHERGTRFRVQLSSMPGIENVFKITGLIDSPDCFYADDQTLPAPPLPEELTKQ